ncbi:unnamed protein product, partial [Discosporangium mesarthrocarpum]
MRAHFEQAVGAVGVHPIHGGVIWDAYIKFEEELLEDMQAAGG